MKLVAVELAWVGGGSVPSGTPVGGLAWGGTSCTWRFRRFDWMEGGRIWVLNVMR